MSSRSKTIKVSKIIRVAGNPPTRRKMNFNPANTNQKYSEYTNNSIKYARSGSLLRKAMGVSKPPLLAHVAATRMVIIFLKGKGGKEAA
jgi:hypothetical protein